MNDTSRSAPTPLPFSNPLHLPLGAVQRGARFKEKKKRYERYFSLALLFVTCRAQITPLQIGISIWKSTLEKSAFSSSRFPFRWTERTEPGGCPRTSYGAVRSPFHKSRPSSYLEMKLLTRLERSAASPAVTHPLHTRTHTHAYSLSLTHMKGGAIRLRNGSYCVNGGQLWTTVFLFLRSGISEECASEREKAPALLIGLAHFKGSV